jgi:hypothetical protein
VWCNGRNSGSSSNSSSSSHRSYTTTAAIATLVADVQHEPINCLHAVQQSWSWASPVPTRPSRTVGSCRL